MDQYTTPARAIPQEPTAGSPMTNPTDREKSVEVTTRAESTTEAYQSRGSKQSLRVRFEDSSEEDALPATLGLGFATNEGGRGTPPEGSGPSRVVWGEVGRGLVAASSGDERGEFC